MVVTFFLNLTYFTNLNKVRVIIFTLYFHSEYVLFYFSIVSLLICLMS